MTYDQYWYGDTKMARAFYKAEKNRQEQRDAQAWLIGSYVGRAIDSTIGNAFRKQGATPQKYPDIPDLTKKRMDEEEAKREKTEDQEEQESLFAEAYMRNMARMGKKWGKKG